MKWFNPKWHGILLLEALFGYVLNYITLLFMPFSILLMTIKKIGLIR